MLRRTLVPHAFALCLLMTVTVAAIPPPTAPEEKRADAVDPLPQVIVDPLPRIHGFNADFLDGYSNEHFFDAIAVERDARVAADAAEAAARAAADATLQENIDQEAAERRADDEDLRTKLDGEVSARAAADADLGARLGSEADARAGADDALSGRVDGLETRAAVVEGIVNGGAVKFHGQKVCMGTIFHDGIRVIHLMVPPGWTASECARFVGNMSGFSTWVGCVFDTTWSEARLPALPSPNCGW